MDVQLSEPPGRIASKPPNAEHALQSNSLKRAYAGSNPYASHPLLGVLDNSSSASVSHRKVSIDQHARLSRLLSCRVRPRQAPKPSVTTAMCGRYRGGSSAHRVRGRGALGDPGVSLSGAAVHPNGEPEVPSNGVAWSAPDRFSSSPVGRHLGQSLRLAATSHQFHGQRGSS